MKQKIAIIPVYNEEKTVVDIIREIILLVDAVIIIDDGSTDGSAELIRRYFMDKDNVFLITLERNYGKSKALKCGFNKICDWLKQGKITDEDIVITVDADGQHLGGDINAIYDYMLGGGYDFLIMRRDFFSYPLFKIIGNKGLSFIASLLGGIKYKDIECGFRFIKAGIIPELMKYYTGFKYSCEQEMGIIAARLKYKIDNTYIIKPRFYRRRGTKVPDGLINIFFGVIAFIKVTFKIYNR